MQIFSWDSTVNQLIFYTACLAGRRQRAARHLCFNIYDTQASGLWYTLAFCMESVWNLQTKHDEWWVVEAIVTGATVHCTMPASQHVSGNHIETTETMRIAQGFISQDILVTNLVDTRTFSKHWHWYYGFHAGAGSVSLLNMADGRCGWRAQRHYTVVTTKAL